MPKDNDSELQSGSARIPFVWDGSEPTGENSSPGTSGPRKVSRPRTLLIGSGVLIVLAGAGYGTYALTTPQHPDTSQAAAMTRPSPQLATLPNAASTSPSPSASVTKSPSPTHSTALAARPTTAPAPATRAPAHAPTVPAPVGDWLLNQTTGNVAVDTVGKHDGTAQDGWWAGGTFLVNGSNSQIYTDGPVLSTGPGASFTVSAWVDMTALPASGIYDESAVSQDGGIASGFYLQYDEPTNRWAFGRAAVNGESSAVYRALSASPPARSTWTHLVGVYDAENKTQYLYVNGVAQGTATDATPFAAPGDLAIGRAQYNGQEQDWFKGAIKKVEVFDTALSAAQVAELS